MNNRKDISRESLEKIKVISHCCITALINPGEELDPHRIMERFGENGIDILYGTALKFRELIAYRDSIQDKIDEAEQKIKAFNALGFYDYFSPDQTVEPGQGE